MTTTRKKKGEPIEEWKVAQENARHFNDLLMRLRMLGLPIVVTIAGAGLVISNIDIHFVVQKGLTTLVGVILGSFLTVFLFRLWYQHIGHLLKMIFAFICGNHTEKWKLKKPFPVPFFVLERIMWSCAIALYIVLSSISFYVKWHDGVTWGTTEVHNLSAFIIAGAIVLLIALYIMDRFYYYKLLVGAVERASEIEKIISYNLTNITTTSISRSTATTLVTLFYWLPCIAALIVFTCLTLFR